MAGTSSIEWCDKTWNPVRGCTRVSPGCVNCYAESVAARFAGPDLPYEGLAKRTSGGPRWTGQMSFGHDLYAPLRWRKPSRIFVNSMSDLFHERLSVDEIATVYAVCVAANHLRGHISQILTKRSARMREVLTNDWFWEQVNAEAGMHVMDGTDPLARRSDDARATLGEYGPDAPPPGVWLGVSCEDQARADERVPDLLATPAAVRFVSAEPLLGPIDFTRINRCDPSPPHNEWSESALHGCVHPWATGGPSLTEMAGAMPRLDLIIVGGESGPRARHLWTPNVRGIVRQCAEAGTACFVKQLGADVRDRNDAGFEGCEPHEWPDVDPADVEHDLDGTTDDYQGAPVRIQLRDRKGGDPSEWPADLRVRQMPAVADYRARDEALRSRS